MTLPTNFSHPAECGSRRRLAVPLWDALFQCHQHILLALIFIGLLLPLHAEEPTTTRSFRVAAVDILPGHDTIWLRTGVGTEPLKVRLNIRTFSQPIRYTGPARALFFRDEAEASLKEIPAPLASATLGEKASLIVFYPNAERTGYRTMVVGDSDFPFGSFRFVNGSGVSAQVKIGDETLLLKRGAAGTAAFRQAKNSLPLRIMTETDEGQARLARQSNWSIDPMQRELILLMPGAAQGLVTFRHFIDSKTE